MEGACKGVIVIYCGTEPEKRGGKTGRGQEKVERQRSQQIERPWWDQKLVESVYMRTELQRGQVIGKQQDTGVEIVEARSWAEWMKDEIIGGENFQEQRQEFREVRCWEDYLQRPR